MLRAAIGRHRARLLLGAAIGLSASALAVLGAVGGSGSPVVDLSMVAVSGVTRVQAETYAIVALEHAWVQKELAGSEYRVVEISDYGDDKSPPLVWIYDYTNNVAIAVAIDSTSGAVADAWVSNSMPNVSEAERVEAATIALEDAAVLRRLGDVPYVVANITDSMGGSSQCRRCLAVFLAPRDGNWDNLIVPIVDLGKKAVVTFAR